VARFAQPARGPLRFQVDLSTGLPIIKGYKGPERCLAATPSANISSNSKAGLEQIGDTITKDNPRRAATFIRELRQAAIAIGDALRSVAIA
jgi:hypothetical protein